MEQKKKKPVTKAAEAPAAKQQQQQQQVTGQFAFGKENYIIMLIGLAFILVGFLLMIGGGSDDPKVFNPDIFSFRRITLSPILVLAGFVIEIYAIMKKPKD